MKGVIARHWVRLLFVTAAMFCFGFATVPLYDKLCYALGLNGKVATEAAAVQAVSVDKSRTVTVEFITTVNAGRPWKFRAEQAQVKVHPGEYATVTFTLENNEDHAIVARAIPNVAPTDAAQYMKKTECFCFNNQSFAVGEQKRMPVVFMLDPAMPADIDRVTLAYTYFDVTDTASAQN